MQRKTTNRRTQGSGYHTPTLATFGPYSNHRLNLMPCFDPGDGGDDSGEGGGGDEEAEGSGEEVAFDENDTKKYKFPGADKAMTVKEYQAHMKSAYLPKSQYEGSLKAMSEIAKAIREGKAKQGAGQGQGQGQGRGQQGAKQGDRAAAKDMLEELEARDLIDGKTVAGVLRQVQQNTLTPLAQLVIGMAKELKELKQGHGRFVQERTEQDFGGEVTGVLKAIGVPDGVEGADIFGELVRDFFLSYDDEDRPKLRQGDTLQKLFKSERFDKLRKAFRALDKAELKAAQERARKQKFVKPGSGSTPNGKGRRLRSNSEIADLLHGDTQVAH